MWRVLKTVLRGLVIKLALEYRRLSIEMLKIEAARWYVKGVAGARVAFIGYVGLMAVLLLALSGFLLFHVGLFLLLPWPLKAKAALLAGLGLLYLIVALLGVRYATSSATWLKLSRADEVVEKLTGRKP